MICNRGFIVINMAAQRTTLLSLSNINPCGCSEGQKDVSEDIKGRRGEVVVGVNLL